jgi:hypothetical protein
MRNHVIKVVVSSEERQLIAEMAKGYGSMSAFIRRKALVTTYEMHIMLREINHKLTKLLEVHK